MIKNKRICLWAVVIWGLLFAWSPFLFAETEPITAWMKIYNSGAYDQVNGIVIDDSGYIFTVGVSNSDMIIMKYDSKGNTVSKILWNNSPTDGGQGIALDDSGCIYTVGYFYNGSDDDFVTIKWDSSGNTIWQKTYNGGFGDDMYGVAVDPSGNVYAAGTSNNGTDNDWFVIKYNSGGDSIWQKSYNGGDQDNALGIAFDGNTGVYVIGYSYNGLNNDLLLIKYDSDGNTVWQKYHDGGNYDYGRCVAFDSPSYVYAAGSYNNGTDNDVLLIKYDTSGNTVWVTACDFGYADVANALCLDSEGNIYVAGSANNNFNDDLIAIKYDTSGNTLWVKRYDSSSNDAGNGIVVERGTKDVYVGGYSTASDFDYLVLKYSQDPAVKFRITSSPFTVMASHYSRRVTVEAQDESGTLDEDFSESAFLVTSSAGGAFSASNTVWQDTSLLHFVFGTASFYYKDLNTGMPVITVYRPDMIPDAQTETIVPAAANIDALGSAIKISSYAVPASGTDTAIVNVLLRDGRGVPMQGRSAELFARRGDSTTVTSSPQITDVSGWCTFSVSSVYAGIETLTAVCDGNSISNCFYSGDVVCLPFEEVWTGTQTMHDASGHGNDGTLSGVTGEINGRNLSYAAVFNGTSDYVNIPNSASLNSPSLTVVAWIKPTVLRIQGIAGRTPATASWELYMSDGTGHVSFNALGAYQVATISTALPGTWYHIAVTYDSTEQKIKIFWNGAPESTYSSVPGAGNTAANPVEISHTSTNRFSGSIDDFKIYNRALSAREIQFEYKAGAEIYFASTALRITTPQRTTTAGIPSDSIVVQARDASGNVDALFDETITLLSSSLNGRFSLSKMPWSGTTEIVLSKGQQAFYYRDWDTGTPVITVYRAGLVSNTQVVIVNEPAVSEAASSLKIHNLANGRSIADGVTLCTVTVEVRGGFGETLAGKQVTVYSSRGASFDTVSYPFGQVTDGNGICTAFICSSYAGEDTITAVCDGVTIAENIINNPSFEIYNGSIVNWSYNTPTGLWSMSTDAYDGMVSIFHTCATSSNNYAGVSWPGNTYTSVWPAYAGDGFLVSGYIKTDNLTSSNTGATFYLLNHSDNIPYELAYVGNLTGTNPWTYVSGYFTVKMLRNGFEFRCMNEGMGTAWFDAVRVQRIPTLNFTAARLGFSTPERSVAAGAVSESIAIEACGEAGGRDVTSNDKVELYTSSITGKFSVSDTLWVDVTAVFLAKGCAVFYYKDSNTGNPVITVSRSGLAIDTQAVTVNTPTAPALNIVKTLENVRTGETGVLVRAVAGDTLEYCLDILNTGDETITEAVICDTWAFDTSVNNPVIFISMDTFPADSWAYTLAGNPSDTDWIAGEPSSGSEDIKGLRWRMDFLVPADPKAIRFRIKVK